VVEAFSTTTKPLTASARIPQFTLRWLLLLFIPISVLLTAFAYVERQKQRAVGAWHDITDKGVGAKFSRDGRVVGIYFRNGNVTDKDLDAFVPAFNGYAPMGFERITMFDLFGSKVSSEAIERFQRAVPECEIVP
jgi:hypothetical protein